MSRYRRGDVMTPHGPLRLTVGGLAEIADGMGASGPAALAARLRDMRPPQARLLVEALARPCGWTAATLDDGAVAALLPGAATCITTALS